MRGLEYGFSHLRIHSPVLRAKVQRFYKTCYLPAYERYVTMRRDEMPHHYSQLEAAVQRYGEDDVTWLGSQTFQTVNGFYDAFDAPPHALDKPSRWGSTDRFIDHLATDKPGWFASSCLTWWQSRWGGGLRVQLLSELTNPLNSFVARLNLATWAPITRWQDVGLRAALSRVAPRRWLTLDAQTEAAHQTGLMHTWGTVASQLMTPLLALEGYPLLHLIENALSGVASGVIGGGHRTACHWFTPVGVFLAVLYHGVGVFI